MKTISFHDTGHIDLTEKPEIDTALNLADLSSATIITVDMSKCFISYDTSYLIDSIIKKISDKNVQKTIKIKTDYKFVTENSLLDCLLRDTAIINDRQRNENTKSTISRIKEAYNVIIEIAKD